MQADLLASFPSMGIQASSGSTGICGARLCALRSGPTEAFFGLVPGFLAAGSALILACLVCCGKIVTLGS